MSTLFVWLGKSCQIDNVDILFLSIFAPFKQTTKYISLLFHHEVNKQYERRKQLGHLLYRSHHT